MRRSVSFWPVAVILLTSALCWVFTLAGGIRGVVAWYLFQSLVPLLGTVFLLAVLIGAIRKRRFDRRLLGNLIVCAAAIAPAALMFGFLPVAYPASIERTKPWATVRLPADVPLKVAWGGDGIDVNYHAIVPDQRWAYDLFVEPYLTGSSELEDYGCYGVPVVAPARGRAAGAFDEAEDVMPGELTNLEAPFGNHVIIELETGTFLVIAHLKQGSVVVETGSIVDEGTVIGQCGNSGHTTEPHIHIHHQRQDPNVYPINLAEGLPLFFRDHDGPPMPEGGIREENGRPLATGMSVRHLGDQSMD